MARRIKGSVVVITGASTGIGRCTALEFARKGANLVLAARNADALYDIAAECADLNPKVCALAVPTDVCDEDAVQHLAHEALDRFGRIDTWVNNAAISVFGRFEDVPSDVFRQVIETNVFGYAHGARAALAAFREQGSGCLINVSSVVGKAGGPFLSAYSTSKFAITGLSECLRIENLHEGIDVCTILPSSTDTPIFQHAANFSGRATKPMPPIYEPERVAKAIVSAARRPHPEISVGFKGHILRIPHALSRRVYDRIAYKKFDQEHFQDRPERINRGNLFRPAPYWSDDIRGNWLPDARPQSHTPGWAKALGLALPAAGIGLGLSYLLASRGDSQTPLPMADRRPVDRHRRAPDLPLPNAPLPRQHIPSDMDADFDLAQSTHARPTSPVQRSGADHPGSIH